MTENASSKSERKQCTKLQIIYENRLKYPRNSLIGYLNINSLRNKIVDAREVFGKFQLDYFVLSETKLDDSFLSAQFYIENFEIRNRRDRDNGGGGLIEFVKKWFITKKIKEYEAKVSETLLLSLPYERKSGFVYRPSTSTNLDIFFEELTNSLSKVVNKYDNLIVMSDFNIDLNKTYYVGFGKSSAIISISQILLKEMHALLKITS